MITIIGLIIIAFIDELILLVKTLVGVDKKVRETDINEIIGKIKAESDAGDETPEIMDAPEAKIPDNLDSDEL